MKAITKTSVEAELKENGRAKAQRKLMAKGQFKMSSKVLPIARKEVNSEAKKKASLKT